MPNRADQFRLFILGLPAVGKSTARRYISEYLSEALPRNRIASFDDYTVLIEMMQNPEEKRFMANPKGQFRINEDKRQEVMNDALTRLRSAVDASAADICVVEFSRCEYVDAVSALLSGTAGNYALIYLRVDDSKERRRRNLIRSPDQPVRSIPDDLMHLPSLSKDDVAALSSSHPGRLREIDTSNLSLARMRDEVCACAKEVLEPKYKFRVSRGSWKEWVLFFLVLFQSVVPLVVVFAVWAFPEWPVATAIWHLCSLPAMRSMTYVACAGALGAAAYSIRCIGRYSISGMLDVSAYKWWYVLRPLEGGLLAIGVYALLRGGIAAIGARFDTTAPNANYGFFGLGFLIGVATEAFMEWLVVLAKKIAQYRVQPLKYQAENDASNNVADPRDG